MGVRAGDAALREPGQRIGRYIVLDELGAGGMGVVLSAYDPELDRRVALKVLRPEAIAEGSKAVEHTVRLGGDGDPRDLVRERLLREGRAMARLSHPNLVAIYEVGEVGERVFLAMEQVEGVRLSTWLETDRSWREVLAAFAQAGRALAAAHAAGLVHGDVKPDNVLVESSGRVRVLDFGLARAAGSAAEEGHLVGTPRYMAPEQFACRPVDARCDQFAFCVSLYEALYRARPFAGETDAEIAASVTAGRPRSPQRRGPRWLERAVMTGLSTDPASRFGSMDELLAVIERRPRLTRMRIGGAVAGLLAAGFISVGFAVGHQGEPDRCSGGRTALARVWDRGAAGRVARAFAASGRQHARASATRVAERLDRYTGEWAALHRATCEATERGEQSPDLLDRRMACLGRRLGQVGALVELFVRRADGDVVDGAVDMAAGLEPLAVCSDSTALLDLMALPADPARRARIAELERKVDRAEVNLAASRLPAAVAEAREVIAGEPSVGYPLLAARAGRVLGRALPDLGPPEPAREENLRAQKAAERAGDTRLAATLLVDLVNLVGERQGRRDEARLIGSLAEAALQRAALRGDHRLRSSLLTALGNLAFAEGKLDESIALLREAQAIRRRHLPEDDPEIASGERSLGMVFRKKAMFEQSRVHMLEGLRVRQRASGDDHVLTASARVNLAGLYLEERRTAEARVQLVAARAVLERAPEHRAYSALLNDLGRVATAEGNYREAVAHHEAALAVRVRQFGPRSLDAAISEHNLANAFHNTGQFGRALEHHRRSLDLLQELQGAEHSNTITALSSIGEDLRALGRPREALVHQERALRLIAKTLGTNHPRYGGPLAYKGLALVDLGRRREAIPLLERAIALLAPAHQDRPRAQLALARSLEPRRPRSRRVKLLVIEAMTRFAGLRVTRELDAAAAYLRRGDRR